MPNAFPDGFCSITGDLRLGGRYQLKGNAGGEISRCEPPRLLAVTWEFGGEVSWLTVRLSEPAKAMTLLELEHVAPTMNAGSNSGQERSASDGIWP